jgi:hypothetical protein
VNSTLVLVDNTFAINLVKNPRFHDQTKYINKKYHLIRYHVEACYPPDLGVTKKMIYQGRQVSDMECREMDGKNDPQIPSFSPRFTIIINNKATSTTLN